MNPNAVLTSLVAVDASHQHSILKDTKTLSDDASVTEDVNETGSTSDASSTGSPNLSMVIEGQEGSEMGLSESISALMDEQDSAYRRMRKTPRPRRSVPEQDDIPGIVFRFGASGDIKVIRQPSSYPDYSPCSASPFRRRRLNNALAFSEPDQYALYRRMHVAGEGELASLDGIVDGRSFDDINAYLSATRPPGMDEFEWIAIRKRYDEDKPKKKRGKRSNKLRNKPGDKCCSSCKTTQTPIWREVKESWGEGWEEVLLCNACGLRRIFVVG